MLADKELTKEVARKKLPKWAAFGGLGASHMDRLLSVRIDAVLLELKQHDFGLRAYA